MKSIAIKTGKLKSIFEQLSTAVVGKVTVESNEYCLSTNNSFAKGKIIGSAYSDSLYCLEFNMAFHEDTIINIKSLHVAPVFFAYCSNGNLSHRFGFSGEIHLLKKYQTAIISSGANVDNFIMFEAKVPTKFVLIVVSTEDKNPLTTESFNARVKQTFINNAADSNLFYMGMYDMKIAEKIEQLEAVSQKGIIRNLLKEGILKIILAMEIQRHTEKIDQFEKETTCLTLREIEEIKKLSNHINQSPEEHFTIKSLSRRSGLSPNKLQEGFKLIHERTVNDYITHVRVLKAEILIRNSDLNISEIVYCIGFTSRSYFSKIFKEKFNCSPKEYKYNLSPSAITA